MTAAVTRTGNRRRCERSSRDGCGARDSLCRNAAACTRGRGIAIRQAISARLVRPPSDARHVQSGQPRHHHRDALAPAPARIPSRATAISRCPLSQSNVNRNRAPEAQASGSGSARVRLGRLERSRRVPTRHDHAGEHGPVPQHADASRVTAAQLIGPRTSGPRLIGLWSRSVPTPCRRWAAAGSGRSLSAGAGHAPRR